MSDELTGYSIRSLTSGILYGEVMSKEGAERFASARYASDDTDDAEVVAVTLLPTAEVERLRGQVADSLGWLRAIGAALGCEGGEQQILDRAKESALEVERLRREQVEFTGAALCALGVNRDESMAPGNQVLSEIERLRRELAEAYEALRDAVQEFSLTSHGKKRFCWRNGTTIRSGVIAAVRRAMEGKG